MKTLIHTGCGPTNLSNLPPHFQDGSWDELRYDIDPSVNPDIIGSLQDMSLLEDNSADAIYSSHNIEHVHEFEVKKVLSEFSRILKPDGLLVILCPDILSVAEAITQGGLNQILYDSPAGPITALDILYGFQKAISEGNEYMAHKTAFTAETLADNLFQLNFIECTIARDIYCGLHAIATKQKLPVNTQETVFSKILPSSEYLIEIKNFVRNF